MWIWKNHIQTIHSGIGICQWYLDQSLLVLVCWCLRLRLSFSSRCIYGLPAFIVTGILELIHAISTRHYMPNWAWLIGGILLLSRPQTSMSFLPFFVGFGIMFRSMMSITWSIELKKLGDKNWCWMFSIGIIGLLISFLLLWNPVSVRLTTALSAGIYFIIIGFTQPFLSLRLSRINRFTIAWLLESTTTANS